MAHLTVEIDDELLAELERSAELNGRSLQEHVEYSLRMLFPKRNIAREDLREAAERIAAMTPKGVKQIDSVKILRAHRDGAAVEE